MNTPSDWIGEIRARIIQPIVLLIANRYHGAAVILILSGIDAMANVNRVAPQASTPDDFRTWVRLYFAWKVKLK